MQQRRCAWGIAGVLTLLLLRSLVPVGFMLAPVDGTLTLVLCEGQGAIPQTAHAHHHHPGNGVPDSMRHAGGDCAYAQSAHAALTPPLDLSPTPVLVSNACPDVFESGSLHSAPPRYRAARGPPHLV